MAMTDEERFTFDLTGWFVRPSILSADEVAAIRGQIETAVRAPESLPPHERHSPGGASSLLVGHPRIADVLYQVLGKQVRCDTTWFMHRERGVSFDNGRVHRGAWSPIDPIFGYGGHGERIHAGQVNVVVELTDVGIDDGATGFIDGSHKASFPLPPGHDSTEPGRRSRFYRSYACPAGSAVFFNESLLHAGPVWQRDTPRIAVLSTYLPVGICHHRPDTSPEVLAGLPPEKRAWFREPWTVDFMAKPPLQNSVDAFVANGHEFWQRRGG